MKIQTDLDKERREILEHNERELVVNAMKIADIKRSIADILEEFKNGSNDQLLKRKLRRLLKDEGDWDYFYNKFVQVHPNFSGQLKRIYPDLTKNDIDFCILLKLRLTNKELANMLNISHKSVISKRYRLRKKMSLREEDTLEDVIGQI
ncbi:helix-turn-helix transcriptional regulator [Sinomicrobium sp.]